MSGEERENLQKGRLFVKASITFQKIAEVILLCSRQGKHFDGMMMDLSESNDGCLFRVKQCSFSEC